MKAEDKLRITNALDLVIANISNQVMREQDPEVKASLKLELKEHLRVQDEIEKK